MKTTLITLIIICSIGLQAQNRLKFERLDNMPNPAASFSMAQSEHDIYAIGGQNWTQWVSSDIQIYDSKAEVWIEAPLKEVPRFINGSALYLENHDCVMLAGGVTPYGSSLNLMERMYAVYPKTLEVRDLGPNPAPARKMGVAYADEKVYMFGGSTYSWRSELGRQYYRFSKKLYQYDLFSGEVKELADMPFGMETQGGIIDGKLYLFGGFDGTQRSTVYTYDIAANEWTKLPNLEKTVSDPALIQYKHYFILVGDYTQSNQLIVYNTKTQQAKYFKTNIMGRRLGASILGDDLHVYGGMDTNLGFLRQEHYKLPIEKIIGKKGSIQ